MQSTSPSFLHCTLWILRAIVMHLRIFISIILISAVLAVVLTGLIDKEYDATAVISPPISPSTPSLSGMMDDITGMDVSKLLGGGGLNLGGSNEENIIRALLASKPLHDAIIDSFDLEQAYEFKREGDKPFYYADLLKRFRGNFKVGETDEEFIQITYRDKDPERAYKLMNFALAMLDSQYFHFKKNEVLYAMRFAEEQLVISNAKMDTLERLMIQFQTKTGIVDPEAQLTSSLKILADLEAQREIAKMQMELEEKMNGSNGLRYQQLKGQYAVIDQSVHKLDKGNASGSVIGLKTAPQNILTLQKLKRNYLMQNAITSFLRQNYEQLVLQSSGNIGKFQIIEKPWLNNKKSYPPRSAYVIAIFLLSFCLATSIVVLMEFIAKEKKDNTPIYQMIKEMWQRLIPSKL